MSDKEVVKQHLAKWGNHSSRGFLFNKYVKEVLKQDLSNTRFSRSCSSCVQAVHNYWSNYVKD